METVKIKVNKNRKVYILQEETDKAIEKIGTQNENNATEIEIEVPEKYEGYNKKIVFVTDNGTIWDIIENNKYKLTKAITKYKSVKFYIWLTKGEEDFRSEERLLIFNDNTNVDKEIEPEEIDGINKVIKIVEDEIIKVTELEKEIKVLISDIQNKLENGELKGEKGDSGIVGFEIREGNLIAISENRENIERFKIKEGNMILTV